MRNRLEEFQPGSSLTNDGSMTVDEAIASVLDLFPSADVLALRVLADALMHEVPQIDMADLVSENEELKAVPLELVEVLRLLREDLRELRERVARHEEKINRIESAGAAKALGVLTRAMREDSGYALSWQANVAMAAHDAGAPMDKANERADDFMMHAFDIDMRQVRPPV